MKTVERRIAIEKLRSKHIFWISANSVILGLAFVLLYIFLRELYNPSGKVPLITFSFYILLFAVANMYIGATAASIFRTDGELLFNQAIIWNDRIQRCKNS